MGAKHIQCLQCLINYELYNFAKNLKNFKSLNYTQYTQGQNIFTKYKLESFTIKITNYKHARYRIIIVNNKLTSYKQTKVDAIKCNLKTYSYIICILKYKRNPKAERKLLEVINLKQQAHISNIIKHMD